MKRLIGLLAGSLLVIACSDANNRTGKVDTSYTTDVSIDERVRQIDHAKHNKELLSGKWKLIDVRSADEVLAEVPLAEFDFDELRFPSSDSFAVLYKKKVKDKGTMEWMAEDRELVLTPASDNQVRRILIKDITPYGLKIKFNKCYLTFKKVG
jgi:hypothetical protein